MNVYRDTVEKYFRRLHRHERLKKIGGLPNILANEEDLIMSAKKELAEQGMDVDTWMTTAQGQMEYLTFCATEDHLEQCSTRCGRCLNYKYIDHFGCSISDSTPFRCPHFVDSGFDVDLRIARFLVNRCSTCRKHFEVQIIDGLSPEIKCSKNLDQLTENCPEYDDDCLQTGKT